MLTRTGSCCDEFKTDLLCQRRAKLCFCFSVEVAGGLVKAQDCVFKGLKCKIHQKKCSLWVLSVVHPLFVLLRPLRFKIQELCHTLILDVQ